MQHGTGLYAKHRAQHVLKPTGRWSQPRTESPERWPWWRGRALNFHGVGHANVCGAPPRNQSLALAHDDARPRGWWPGTPWKYGAWRYTPRLCRVVAAGADRPWPARSEEVLVAREAKADTETFLSNNEFIGNNICKGLGSFQEGTLKQLYRKLSSHNINTGTRVHHVHTILTKQVRLDYRDDLLGAI